MKSIRSFLVVTLLLLLVSEGSAQTSVFDLIDSYYHESMKNMHDQWLCTNMEVFMKVDGVKSEGTTIETYKSTDLKFTVFDSYEILESNDYCVRVDHGLKRIIISDSPIEMASAESDISYHERIQAFLKEQDVEIEQESTSKTQELITFKKIDSGANEYCSILVNSSTGKIEVYTLNQRMNGRFIEQEVKFGDFENRNALEIVIPTLREIAESDRFNGYVIRDLRKLQTK